MKKTLVCGFGFIILMLATVAFATPVPDTGQTSRQKYFFKGEGYITPTEASQVPFDRELLIDREQLNKSIASTSGAAGNTIVVNALATNFPDIVLYLTARDSNNNYITGLQASQFTITEQSSNETSPKAETITGFSETIPTSSGISITLVFDVSGSMSGQPLADAKTAAINFVKACGPTDRMALVKFSYSSDVSVVRSSDWVNVDANKDGTWDIIDAINSLTIGGNTALFDGTTKGIETLSQEPQPKAVIVFTDGNSNDDSIDNNINTVIKMAQNNSVPLYTIGLGSVADTDLQDMADATGGLYFSAPSALDMADIYKNIAKGLKGQYVIGYTTHNLSFDCTTRKVTVTTQGTSGMANYGADSRPVITLSPETLLLSNQSQQPNVMLTISGWVTDLDAQRCQQNLTAYLYYGFANSTTFTEVALTLTDQGSGKYAFHGRIPGSVVKEPGILYYLHASDGLLETYSPFNYKVLPYSITVLQNHAPIILHTPVTSATINQPVTILANVTDPDIGDSVSRVETYYRIHNAGQNTPYLVVNMTSSSGADFSGIIPGDKLTTAGVDYFISAWDNHRARADTKESYITATLTPVLWVTPSNQIVQEDAGTTTFSISNTGTGTMPWSAAVTSGSWLSITSGASGTNSGTINCSFTANTGTSIRTATIHVTATAATGSPKDVTVIQAPHAPVLWVTPSNRSVTKDAGTTSFNVSNTRTGTMPWSAAVTSGSWLTIKSGSRGTNSGTITCSFTANTSTSSRTATIRVTATGATGSPKSVTVTQASAQTTCTATIDGNLSLHVPYITYLNPILGTVSLWVDFVYEPSPMLVIFKLTNSAVIQNPSFSCAASTLSSNLKIHIHDVQLPNGSHLWMDLEYSAALSTDATFQFVVTNYKVTSK